MTFLNFILLGGLAAAAIPLILHLFNRQRFRVVKWGAMPFLDAVLRTNRKRLLLEQIILLVVRTALLAALALCMARPVLTGARALAHRAMSSLVVLLDNSFSMEAGDAVRSNFVVAREAAATLIEQLPRGSETAVLGLAGPMPEDLSEPGYDLDGARRRLDAAQGGYGAADVPRGLETAAGLFASRLHHVDRTLVVLSDFQRVSWSREGGPARSRARELLAAQPVPPRLVLFPVGRPVRDNVAVESVEPSRSLPGLKQKILVRANVRNLGAQPWNDLRVFFRVDGAERGASQVTLAPGEVGQLLFSHAFEKAGSHVLEVSADADPLKADNTGLAALPVLDRLPVCVVNGDPRPERLQAETAFLEFALRPFAAAGAAGAPAAPELADLIEPRVVPENAFSPEAIGDARVVILANVRQLEDRAVEALRAFVRDGGGLLVFPGDRVNAAWYNDRLAPDASGLLPARLGALAGSPAADAPAAALVAQHYTHPALAAFNDPRKGSLQGAQIRLWYRFEFPPAAATGLAAPDTLLRLDNGDPFLVEKRVGAGRVILCATPCDADWSNLPLRPFYLPLMQELTLHLASQIYPPRNVNTGERLAALLPAADTGKKAVFTDPEGKTFARDVTPSGLRGLVEFTGTERPGLYLCKTPGGETIHFVVRTPPAESKLDRLNDDELKALARDLGATLVRSNDEYRKLEAERRWGREIWKPLLALTLLFLFAELFLVSWFNRRKVA